MLTGSSPEVAVEGYRDNVVHYHLHLLDDAGFLMPLRIKKQPSISITFRGLSWSGHEFLDSVRRKDVWDHTNAILKKAGGGTFEIAKQFLSLIFLSSYRRSLVSHLKSRLAKRRTLDFVIQLHYY
ncbi:DUF2513 domain-containing protein [Agrobacterium rubi]|uniref:DUF2513 domain-containing protein n=1 Tax=Agrobacterium rubi TaxID=28099 RepID=UPI00069A2986